MRRASLLALALCACADEPGRFYPETVIELGRTRGDAVGNTHTGAWLLVVTEVECTCDTLTDMAGETISICPDPMDVTNAPILMTEADGYLELAIGVAVPGANDDFANLLIGLFTQIDLLGKIDADGTFAIGEVRLG
jgi:hypothetical protein